MKSEQRRAQSQARRCHSNWVLSRQAANLPRRLSSFWGPLPTYLAILSFARRSFAGKVAINLKFYSFFREFIVGSQAGDVFRRMGEARLW